VSRVPRNAKQIRCDDIGQAGVKVKLAKLARTRPLRFDESNSFRICAHLLTHFARVRVRFPVTLTDRHRITFIARKYLQGGFRAARGPRPVPLTRANYSNIMRYKLDGSAGMVRCGPCRCRRTPRDFNLTMCALARLTRGPETRGPSPEEPAVRGTNYRANYGVTSLIDR